MTDNTIAKEIHKVSVETELKKSYLDYAMERHCGTRFARCQGWLEASA